MVKNRLIRDATFLGLLALPFVAIAASARAGKTCSASCGGYAHDPSLDVTQIDSATYSFRDKTTSKGANRIGATWSMVYPSANPGMIWNSQDPFPANVSNIDPRWLHARTIDIGIQTNSVTSCMTDGGSNCMKGMPGNYAADSFIYRFVDTATEQPCLTELFTGGCQCGCGYTDPLTPKPYVLSPPSPPAHIYQPYQPQCGAPPLKPCIMISSTPGGDKYPVWY